VPNTSARPASLIQEIGDIQEVIEIVTWDHRFKGHLLAILQLKKLFLIMSLSSLTSSNPFSTGLEGGSRRSLTLQYLAQSISALGQFVQTLNSKTNR
jgi:hypothetical protein